jgi:hypothetical protein
MTSYLKESGNPVILSQLVHLADPVHTGDILDESPVHVAAFSLCTVYSREKISRIFSSSQFSWIFAQILEDLISLSFVPCIFTHMVFYGIEVAPVPRIDMHRMQIISGLE